MIISKFVIGAYLKSIDSTVLLEKIFYRLYGFEQTKFDNFPRPDIWIHYVKKYNVDGFSKNLRVLFIYIFIPVYYTYLMIKYILIKTNKRYQNDADYIIIGTSEKSIELAKQNLNFSYNVLELPWKKLDTDKKIKLSSLYSQIDLFSIYIISLKFAFKIYKKKPEVTYQMYTLYNWLVIYVTLNKIKKHYVTISHTDRWVYMLDQVSKNQGTKFMIIQHGKISFDEGINRFSLIHKIKNVSDIYCYDEESMLYFKNRIISSLSVAYHYFKPTINLTYLKPSTNLYILIIGHPVCMEIQGKIGSYLKFNYGSKCCILYKSHPTVKNSIHKKLINYDNLVDTFPAVDFVISYDSTLAVEYKNVGIKTFIHPEDYQITNSDNILKTIGNIVDNYLTEK